MCVKMHSLSQLYASADACLHTQGTCIHWYTVRNVLHVHSFTVRMYMFPLPLNLHVTAHLNAGPIRCWQCRSRYSTPPPTRPPSSPTTPPKFDSVPISSSPETVHVWDSSVHFGSIQFSLVQFNSVLFNPDQFSSVQCNSVQSSSVQFSLVQFNSVQFKPDHFSTVQLNPDQFSPIQFVSVQFS